MISAVFAWSHIPSIFPIVESFVLLSAAIAGISAILSLIFHILLALMPPVKGIGAYFIVPAICLPSFSKGAKAVAATLVTFFAAMKASHMKARAMISMMMVPNIPQAVERIL